MKLLTLENGDVLHRYAKSLVLCFAKKRQVMSTGPLNGGYQTELKTVFNTDINPGAGIACKLRAGTYEAHIALVATEIGLEPKTTSGISTAANMEYVSIQQESFRDLTVTAIVTGGVETNGGRVGDPADWYEEKGKTPQEKPGTINILLHINGRMAPGAMTRAIVTCTEAKCAALQELAVPSRYSMGLATGSGTDGTIVIADPESELYLTNAGKHSKLGELIGRTVKTAVKEALKKQTQLCPQRQHNVIRRMDRFGVTEEHLWELYQKIQSGNILSRPDFSHRLHDWQTQSEPVVKAVQYAHLLDELQWGLLSYEEVEKACTGLLGIQKQEPITERSMQGLIDAYSFYVLRAVELIETTVRDRKKENMEE